jgi:hypothetical protein
MRPQYPAQIACTPAAVGALPVLTVVVDQIVGDGR